MVVFRVNARTSTRVCFAPLLTVSLSRVGRSCLRNVHLTVPAARPRVGRPSPASFEKHFSCRESTSKSARHRPSRRRACRHHCRPLLQHTHAYVKVCVQQMPHHHCARGNFTWLSNGPQDCWPGPPHGALPLVHQLEFMYSEKLTPAIRIPDRESGPAGPFRRPMVSGKFRTP